MSIVKSSKNKDQVLLDGFRYRRDRKSQTIWRCCRNDCGGRASFDGAIYIKRNNDETAVPNYSSSQRTIKRKRKQKEILSPRPSSYDDIHIADELQVTNGGNTFLLYDNESSTNRMTLLSSMELRVVA
ncbi:unnamed protein product [Rotaria socialis]|uniref:FLYWCH-type domain-containing protein n=1 Tax=Rotaria socialis TaxID=392032 RepID=A0A818UJ75_9BILA|nr:unnamed protein product [Rotaria socialis]